MQIYGTENFFHFNEVRLGMTSLSFPYSLAFVYFFLLISALYANRTLRRCCSYISNSLAPLDTLLADLLFTAETDRSPLCGFALSTIYSMWCRQKQSQSSRFRPSAVAQSLSAHSRISAMYFARFIPQLLLRKHKPDALG